MNCNLYLQLTLNIKSGLFLDILVRLALCTLLGHDICLPVCSFFLILMMDLRIASLNINGFRYKLKHDLVKQFVAHQQKLDMLLLQETYVDNMKLAKTIEQRLNVVNCIWNFSKGASCGVAILIFNKDICIENYHSDFFGRVIKLDFS